ncbi:BCL2 associated agonist of cell death b [Sardina pilchardus]|uniref:BCL2 associated agonist of cell death b n=1 Tax=Sardina pilchardus TaxID=27697 RepID=UPI002E0F5FA5
MANMYISDPELDTSDGQDKPEATKETLFGNTLEIPSRQPPGKLSTRHRVNSEDQTSTRTESNSQGSDHEDDGFFSEPSFRTRSQSAPAALWAAKKYGQQLRRMSDEFDSMLDQREMRRVASAGTSRQMRTSRSWFASLFSHKETDGDTRTAE